MTLAAGFQLGPYQIQSPLGAGGMGEVYKARDTRLERVVAVKILPDALAADPKFRDRFDREARTISQLDHPHICAVFDVGEAPNPESPTGSSTPIRYLVMQYLEGQTLADRIAKGPLPTGEALTIAIQIADALRGAHRAGIVHRDLKPANVMLTRSGVKLLDFGLAKTSLSAEAAGLTALPTSPQPLTEQGTILGTFQYMAPEQLEGLEADARTDIFALGAVLYETLTGKKAFDGSSRASVIGAIMHAEPPPITTLQPTTPRAIDRIVQKCLEKDRDERWQSAADLHDSLRWAAEASDTLSSPNQVAPAVRGRAPARREALAWMAAAGFGLATIGLAGAAVRQRSLGDAPVVRTSIVVPNGVVIATAAPNRFALSPDGTRIAIVAVSAGQRARLFVRLLDSLAVLPLAGTEGASGPFWSPDSRRIGFFADGKVKTIGISGGVATILADASALPGGAWNRDDVILFTAADLNGLSRVSAKGGPVSSATALDAAKAENAHLAPYFLPDGDHFLYFSRGSANGPADVGGTYVGSLASKDSKRRVDVGPSAKYAQGAVFFMRDSTLLAQRFNVDRLEPTGDPVTVGEQVDLGGSTGRAGGFSVSDTGVVAYQTAADVRTQLAWFDRAGRQLTTVGELADQTDIDLSPDGTKAVVSLADPVGSSRDLWIYELARGLRTRFTFDPGDEVRGTWFPDGSRIVFGAGSIGKFTVSERTLTGASSQILTATQVFALPTSVSPDGRFVLYADGTPQRSLSSDEWLLPLDGTRKPSPFVQTPFADASGAFSPDGRWVAYSSNESGRNEVYVTRFPQAGRKWQVSAAGGAFPRWRRDGKELFYVSPDNKLLAAGVDGSREAFDVGAVSPLFSVRFRTSGYLGYRGDGNYAVSADGRRFLLNVANAESAPGPITVLANWTAAIRK